MACSDLITQESFHQSQFDITIVWRQGARGDFEVTYPKGFWQSWGAGMRDGAIRFIISLISLRNDKTGHANAILYDKSTNEMERFDPHGAWELSKYKLKELDAQIKADFDVRRYLLPAKVKYFRPDQYCPKIPIFQRTQGLEPPGMDPRGTCSVWRLWYLDMRLSNPNVPRQDAVILAQRKLEQKGSFNRFIKAYTQYLLKCVAAMNRPLY